MLELHPEAAAELEAAVDWLEDERPGYGALLFGEVRQKIAQAATYPHSGDPVAGFEDKHEVRAYTLARFRYRVITAQVSGAPLVIAVAHTSREPSYWRDRIGAPPR